MFYLARSTDVHIMLYRIMCCIIDTTYILLLRIISPLKHIEADTDWRHEGDVDLVGETKERIFTIIFVSFLLARNYSLFNSITFNTFEIIRNYGWSRFVQIQFLSLHEFSCQLFIQLFQRRFAFFFLPTVLVVCRRANQIIVFLIIQIFLRKYTSARQNKLSKSLKCNKFC